MKAKHLSIAFLLAVPTAISVFFGVRFLLLDIPKIEKAERDRVKSLYREHALEISRDTKAFSSYTMSRRIRPAGKMSPGVWGFEEFPEEKRTLVWYKEGEAAYSTGVDYISEADYPQVVFAVVVALLFVLVAVTFFGIRYFYRYITTRDDFLAATAHDLTTPLVGARLAIGRNDGDAVLLVERMLRIVENLKEFLKLDGRNGQCKKEIFDLLASFNEAYSLFSADFEEECSGPVEVLGSPKALLVEGDETKTVQVLWNLLGNDLKYSAPYGKISAEFSRDGDFVRLELRDSGPGMTKKQMRKAFDRYYRAKTVLQTGKGGFGIGLCSAREAVLLMGGTLTVGRNIDTEGCVFTLKLPAARAEIG